MVSVSHQWDFDDNYLIQAKLIDAYGLESNWATLEVTMPKTYIDNPILQFIINLLERFPFMVKILNQYY